jgi:hypothetical protein
MTQYQIIISALKQIYKGFEDKDLAWVYGYELQSTATNAGWIGSNGGRRCRELASKGLIERREKNGQVQYRYIPTEIKIKEKSPEELELEKQKILSYSTT